MGRDLQAQTGMSSPHHPLILSSFRVLVARAFPLLTFFFFLTQVAGAQDVQFLYPDNSVSSKPIIEIRARDPKFNADQLGGRFSQLGGHAFLALGKELDNGTTVFYGIAGFFPTDTDSKERFFLTPGKIDYTLLDLKTDVVYRANITPKQESEIAALISSYNTRKFGAFYRNCLSLVKDASVLLGLNAPFFSGDLSAELPGVWVRMVKMNNDKDTPINFEKKQKEAAAKAEATRQEQERQKEAEQQRIENERRAAAVARAKEREEEIREEIRRREQQRVEEWEAERQRQEDVRRRAEEEARRRAEQQHAEEEAQRQRDEDQRRAHLARALEIERRAAEEEARRAERRRAEMEQERRDAEESRARQELQRAEMERQRAADEARRQAERLP